MTPGNFNLTIYRGDTYRWQFKLWADEAKSHPVDLTGVTAKSEIRATQAGKLIATFICTITLPNIIDVVLDAATSRTLAPKGVWDLQLTYPGGDVTTVLVGSVAVTTDVTESAVP